MIKFIQWFIKPLGYHVISEDDLDFLEDSVERLHDLEQQDYLNTVFASDYFVQPSVVKYKDNVIDFKV